MGGGGRVNFSALTVGGNQKNTLVEVDINFYVFKYLILCSGGCFGLSELKSSEILLTYVKASNSYFYQCN